MTFSVAVAGCTGYAGGEILRLLLGHPAVTIGALTAGGSAGTKLGAHHPHLTPLADRIVEETSAQRLAQHDIVFLALPHGTSAPIAEELPEDVLILDCGADFRLRAEADWATYYGTQYAGSWPYGLPELPGQRDLLVGARRIAVPGCYPTNVTLSLLPAMHAGLITGSDITAAAASGTSGAGKSLKPNLLGAELMGAMSAYSVGGSHRHIPEVLQNLRLLGAANPTISFTPMLAPMSRGILAVCTAPMTTDAAEYLTATYEQTYADEPFVRVLPAGQWPNTKSVLGSNGFHVQATFDERAGRLVTVGVLDNLTKGTAGAAVQCMNLALGLGETTGLSTIGVAP